MKSVFFTLVVLLLQECSSSSLPQRGGRIVGGEEAGLKDAPWQVSLRNFITGNSHFCGGTIIAPSWILTASHCLDGITPIQYEIMAGQHNIRLPDPHEEVRRVKAGFLHPNYTWNDREYDIGLVKLRNELAFTEYIQPIDLYLVPEPTPGVLCEATGWGVTEQGGMFLASALQKVTVPLISDQTCFDTFQSLMRDDMLCAGEEGKDSCSGDSGGPLVCPLGPEGQKILTGVTSWGQGCGQPGKPGVYTEVAYFVDWIRQTMEDYDSGLME